jgi:hypothetical protein
MSKGSTSTPAGAAAPSAPSIYPNANAVHQMFCATREAAKRLRILAGSAEAGAVVLALWRILAVQKVGWLPLGVLLFTLVDVLLRGLVDDLRSFAQRCRRCSIRAIAVDRDLDPATVARLKFERPGVVSPISRGFKCLPIAAYYDTPGIPLPPPGVVRLRVISAHSVFFTERLNRYYFRLLVGVTFIAFLVGFGVIYQLAMDVSTQAQTREVSLDALCSVVFVYLAIRVLETAIRAYRASSRTQSILRSMSHIPLPVDTLLDEIIDEYDFERLSDPDVPTTLYRLFRTSIDREWSEFRPSLL